MRLKPPASFACSSSRNSRVPGTIMTGWLLRMKSCETAPGVRLVPSTPRTRIDMPRMSASRSLSDAALANRIDAA
ncbi:hypothetical protein D3C83_17290 [compost metagenome]